MKVNIYIYIYPYIYIYDICMYVCILRRWAKIYISKSINIYTYIYIYVYVCIGIYIYIFKQHLTTRLAWLHLLSDGSCRECRDAVENYWR